MTLTDPCPECLIAGGHKLQCSRGPDRQAVLAAVATDPTPDLDELESEKLSPEKIAAVRGWRAP